ncbi:MAG TPA: carbohydrate ABC transporter permease [Chloroflexota bacterium]|nr:carbohydrate ABC transporter permease [Chloroflexota bacterium]
MITTITARTAGLVACVLLAAFCVLPFFWILSTSLKPDDAIFSITPQWIPTHPTLGHFQQLLNGTPFARYFLNSMIVSTVTAFWSVLVGICSAYAFSRYRFVGHGFWFRIVLSLQIFPYVVLVIPLYVLLYRLHLIDSYWGLIIAYATFSLPFAVYMLKGYLDSVPRELDEAAQIDGCSTFVALVRVVLPAAMPGVIATFLFGFVTAWNEYLFALTFITSTDMRTLPLGLALFFGEFTTQWGLIMAAAVTTSLPVVLIFLFLQRYLVAGWTAGATKG